MHSLNTVTDHAKQLPITTNWQQYVLGPDAPNVHPARVLTSAGDVVGANEIITGHGSLTLVYPPGGTAPSIVLDYGRNVAGIPWIEVSATSGEPTVRLSYSESAAWTGPDGDGHGSHNDSANRSRVEFLTPTGPGRYSTDLIQGGQRYQRITLENPGSLTLTKVGVLFTAYAAPAENYKGWFLSSSDELNRVWYQGAYTTQLNQLPADTIPPAWQIVEGVLSAKGGTLAVLASAAAWSDISVSFETALVERAAGWVVRAQDEGAHGYLCTLRVGADSEASGSFELSSFDDGFEGRPQDTVRRYTLLASVNLSTPLKAGEWHHVRTTVIGPLISVTLDDVLIGHFDLNSFTAEGSLLETGSFGFHHAWGTSRVLVEHARYRNLSVSGADGSVLFESKLDQPEALLAFSGDGVSSPDPLPVILDGGKRDRSVWSGDLLIQIPNVFYTTGAEEYVRGSIELLNGYQEPTGQSAARIPPIMPIASSPQHGQTYSAVYSMHQVTNVALHHLHTGDVDFVRSQWPAVRRQLAFDETLVDERGLLITDEENGLDWDWYDGPKTGAVSAYNIAGYQTLRYAARLAAAIGEDEEAEALDARADRLRSAVNEHLYDADRHLYVLSELRSDAIAQDANALAVVSGIVPDGEAVALLQSLAEALPSTPFGFSPFSAKTGFRDDISPYVSGTHLTALFEAGLSTDALGLVHDLWGHMADAEEHAVGTAWELLHTDGSPGFGATTSLAHGWACGASVALSSYVLGVRPTAAGFREWVIEPQLGTLTWSRGRVPTPHGPIDVSWKRESDGLVVELTVPAGTTGKVVLSSSLATAAVLTSADTTADVQGIPNRAGRMVFPINAGGRYTVSARP